MLLVADILAQCVAHSHISLVSIQFCDERKPKNNDMAIAWNRTHHYEIPIILRQHFVTSGPQHTGAYAINNRFIKKLNNFCDLGRFVIYPTRN